MGWVVVLLVLALLLGGAGLMIETMRWLLIIALFFLIAGAVFGWRGRRVS